MKYPIFILVMFCNLLTPGCEKEKEHEDYSGLYCLNLQNLEMIIAQSGDEVTFTLQNDLLVNGSGIISGDTLFMTAQTLDSESFACKVTFSADMQIFSGPYTISDREGRVTSSGILVGTRGECSVYDISANGVPEFIVSGFTELDKIEQVSRFRSGFGHSFTDGTESCRSMKHYFNPFTEYRDNRTVEIYAPVNGTITSVSNDGHGASTGLTNKQIQIRPVDQPAFTCQLFHCDLASDAIRTGKQVQAGEFLGYARLHYEDLEEYATSFDVALWVNTASGVRLISYFEAMTDVVLARYTSRGVSSRLDFIITKEERDADPIQCDGERFITSGTLENWVTLAPDNR